MLDPFSKAITSKNLNEVLHFLIVFVRTEIRTCNMFLPILKKKQIDANISNLVKFQWNEKMITYAFAGVCKFEPFSLCVHLGNVSQICKAYLSCKITDDIQLSNSLNGLKYNTMYI